MITLGIETTCDETAVALVKDGKEILSNKINSQIELHQQFSGVFPEYAARRHSEALLPLISEALDETGISPKEIDLLAVAHGPGLIGALLLGLNAAKALSVAWEIPFIGVNHVEAHLYAALMSAEKPCKFPAIGVVLSGGHTAVLHVKSVGDYTLIGTTIDDAIGESFDKVASMLNLPYPGGPAIEKLAKSGERKYPFKAGYVKRNPLNFSFSGLKTNVLYTLKGQNSEKNAPLKIPESEYPDIAASFQHTAFSDVVRKIHLAQESFPSHSLILGGGVTMNDALRETITSDVKIPIFWPSKTLCMDNAAMIAGLGTHQYKLRGADTLDLEARPRIPFAEW